MPNEENENEIITSLDMQLSPNFSLGEMVRTSHRSISNFPTKEVTDRLVVLCHYFLEPLRSQSGPIKINSGYRSPALNKAIGGAINSAHKYGCAADIHPLIVNKGAKFQEVFNWIAYDSLLPYDQLILESSSTSNWIHLGMLRPGFEEKARKQLLRFKGGKYTTYDRSINYGI